LICTRSNQITYEDALRNADSLNDLRLQIKLNSQRGKSHRPERRHRKLCHHVMWPLRPRFSPNRMPNQPQNLRRPCRPKRVAFLGLGVMGYPMAGHLALAGHQVTSTTGPLANQ
jgi:hypothetical protein